MLAQLQHYKTLHCLCHYAHGDTTECASLSGSYCVTKSPLFNTEEIQQRPKIGQKRFQQSADQRE